MNAAVYAEYGPPEVLQYREVETPKPKDNEIRVRVHATSVNYGDLVARNFRDVTLREFNMPGLFWVIAKLSFGLRRPKQGILGSEFSGVVDEVGSAVKEYRPGDAVFGYLGQGMRGYAEFVCVKEDSAVATKPEALSYPEAAVVSYGAVMAHHLVRKAGVVPGQKVLINGASGSIGAAAVQIAKLFGAEVTGVCGSQRVDYVRSLGADHVIDYTKEDFTQNGVQYDLVFDVLGRSTFAKSRNVLSPQGRYLRVSFKTKQLMEMLRTSFGKGQKVICTLAPGGRADLLAVRELIEAGKIRAIVDAEFPLARASEAHRYAESGEKKGPIAIIVTEE